MKLHTSKLHISSGKLKSGFFYKVFHVYKDKISEEIKKRLSGVIDNAIFTGDVGQQYIDHQEKVIYLGVGDEKKINMRKIAALYIKLGEQLIKWKDVGLEIYAGELSAKIKPEIFAYQVANSLEIGAFPIDFLSKSYREKEINPGKIGIVFDNPTEEKEI